MGGNVCPQVLTLVNDPALERGPRARSGVGWAVVRGGESDPLRPSRGRPMVNTRPSTADYSNGFSLSVAPPTTCLGPTASRAAGIEGTP